MDDFNKLPTPVSVCTNVSVFKRAPLNIPPAELAEAFLNARRSNIHTQPVVSTAKEAKKILTRLDSFHSSQLNRFLYGYMYPNETIPESVLNEIRNFCVNVDCEWVSKCQNVAANVLLNELQARSNNVIPRSNPDDPIALPQLRRTLPVLKHVPKITTNVTHFKYVVGMFSPDPEVNAQICSSKVKVQNNGSQTVQLEVTQTQTVIDGVTVDNRYLQTTLQKQELKRGESLEVTFSLKEAPRRGFSDFQQLVVLSVDNLIRIFVTICVVSPRQKIFGQGFPSCLPLRVDNSPLGVYSAPLVLQLLRHQLIRQQGLSSRAVGHLFSDQSVNYKPHNQEVLRDALRVKEIVEEQMNLLEVLDSFWASQPEVKKNPYARYRQPISSSHPAGYIPGTDLPTSGSTSGMVNYFPNFTTKVPDVLSRAPPAVIVSLILIWIAEMDIMLFDSSFANCEPIMYLETMPPHLKGIVMWVLDFCCDLLVNHSVNGVTSRGLAVTFTSLLMRSLNPNEKAQDEIATTSEAFSEPQKTAMASDGVSFDSYVSFRQNAVTAFMTWITVYYSRYSKNVS
ncbi:hypothetical protein, conserved [Angomonas deanei]|uniref:Uncharacterized protein n=1 Tax=Angomonas deanei TaxID=59799 RepID=A0A7G2CC92_9TRYP|nr:hypothetical protein, conserved [Angomonas deanei]